MINDICYIYEDSECTDLILKGYIFFNDTSKAGEFIYYRYENSLEVYDLYEECTKYYCNVSICEIREILKKIFIWGDL